MKGIIDKIRLDKSVLKYIYQSRISKFSLRKLIVVKLRK